MVLTHPVIPKKPDDDDFGEGGEYTGGGGNPYQGGGSGGGQPPVEDEHSVQGPETREEYMEREAPGPRTEEGKYFTGFGNPFDFGVGKFYTGQAYTQFWYERYRKAWDLWHSIEPTSFYQYDGREIYGHSLRQIIRAEYIDPFEKAWKESKTIGDNFEIFRGREGFEFKEIKARDEPSISGFGSYVLHIGDYAWSSITREPWSPGKPVESIEMKEGRLLRHHRDIQAWRERDIGHFASAIASNPYMLTLGTQALGAGFGFLKGTKWGSKVVFQVGFGEKVIGSAPEWTYTKTFDVTRSGLLQSGVYAYPTYEAAKNIYKSPFETLGSMALMLPVSSYFYLKGYKWGYGLAQKRGGLVGLKGLDRTRQVGIYESTDAVYRSKIDYKDLSQKDYFNILKAEHMYRSKAVDLGWYLKTTRFPTRMGGSVAAKIHMGQSFRTGDIPYGLRSWAIQRQSISGYRPLIGRTGPVDIDLWLLGNLGRKGLMASGIPQPHVVDVPKGGFRPGRYYWGGWSELGSVKGKIVDPYLSNLDIKVLPYYEMPGVYGRAYIGELYKGRIELSSRIAQPGYLYGYSDWKYVPTKGIEQPVYMPRVFTKTIGSSRVLLHEFYHHKYPKNISKIPGFGGLHEWKIEAMEIIGPRTKFEAQAIRGWYKTGQWRYRQPITVKTPKLQELFMRKSVSILPSHTKYTGYRSYKDIPDWFEMGKFIYERTRDPKLYLGMAKVTHPELFTPPKITLGERIVARLGGPVKPSGVYDTGSSVYLSYPKSYGYPKGLTPVMGYYKATDRTSMKPTRYIKPVETRPYHMTFIPTKSNIPMRKKHTFFVPTYKRTMPPYKIPKQDVIPKPVVVKPPSSKYEQQSLFTLPGPISKRFDDATPKRIKKKRTRLPIGTGYKFRLFESSKFDYKSPFKI